MWLDASVYYHNNKRLMSSIREDWDPHMDAVYVNWWESPTNFLPIPSGFKDRYRRDSSRVCALLLHPPLCKSAARQHPRLALSGRQVAARAQASCVSLGGRRPARVHRTLRHAPSLTVPPSSLTTRCLPCLPAHACLFAEQECPPEAGMRVYHNDSWLISHTDRHDTHALSLILNLDQVGAAPPHRPTFSQLQVAPPHHPPTFLTYDGRMRVDSRGR